MEESIRAENAVVLVISIFLYGFIGVITLIGITNIFNTITTNMNLRKKEFAMLKSIGMTKKEFNRMIRLESIFYGVKSLVIGIPIGLVLSYGMYNVFRNSMEIEYVLPYKSIVVAVIFVAIVIGIIMRYSMSKINKQNIIETIRNDNI
ncbi:MAG: FtsX-like permease family protein [Clostridia bacterium]